MLNRNKEVDVIHRSLTGDVDRDVVPYLLYQRAISSPRDVAFSYPESNQNYTWSMVWQESRLLAQGLLSLGIKKGDHVAILMSGRMELVLSILAAACIGAVVVPLNTYSKKNELTALLMDAKPKVLIMGTEGNHQHYPSMMQEIINDCIHSGIDCSWLPQQVFVVDEAANVPRPFHSYKDLFTLAAAVEDQAFAAVFHTLQADDPLVLLYTSGTTGTPKGVHRTTASFMVSQRDRTTPRKGKKSSFMQKLTNRITSNFSVFNLLPLFHLGGFATLITNLKACNIRIVMLSHYNPVNALSVLSQGKYHFLVGTPFMIQQMLSCPERSLYDQSSVLGVIFTSSAVNNSILQRVTREMNLAFFMVSYGSSEAGSVSNGLCLLERKSSLLLVLMIRLLKHTKFFSGIITKQEFEQSAYSLAGKVDKSVQVSIIHPETEELLPLYEQGEVVIKSHRVMRYSKEDNMSASLTRDGWYKSGDIGFLNENNHLTIIGRLHRVISRGGEKISPVEIENVLLKHEDVEEALVIGIPDELYGEQICACIIPAKGRYPEAYEINRMISPHLSAYKLPKYYVYLPQFPLSPTGKVAIPSLQAIAIDQLGELKEYA